MDRLARRDKLLRYACLAMVIAAGLQSIYAAVFESTHVRQTPYWAAEWATAYTIFVLAYVMTPSRTFTAMTPRQGWLIALQAICGIALVWLYPSFIVTCLLVVVAWQLALLLELRYAIAAAAALGAALGLIRCTGQTEAMTVLVVVSCVGFQLFAVAAAQLLRSEIAAREELARANTELQATQALLDESARLAERVRIARDIHDVMGHTLTTLTIHLDVATKMVSGPAAEHLAYARTASGELLEQVRAVVSRFRNLQPTNLRSALEKLVVSAKGLLEVQLHISPSLAITDPAQAETVIRCVQEVITNAMRHARARELVITVSNADEGIVIAARDDGYGGQFAPGTGLLGMRERFESLGGRLSIKSAAGQGFSVEGVLPMAGSPS